MLFASNNNKAVILPAAYKVAVLLMPKWWMIGRRMDFRSAQASIRVRRLGEENTSALRNLFRQKRRRRMCHHQLSRANNLWNYRLRSCCTPHAMHALSPRSPASPLGTSITVAGQGWREKRRPMVEWFLPSFTVSGWLSQPGLLTGRAYDLLVHPLFFFFFCFCSLLCGLGNGLMTVLDFWCLGASFFSLISKSLRVGSAKFMNKSDRFTYQYQYHLPTVTMS